MRALTRGIVLVSFFVLAGWCGTAVAQGQLVGFDDLVVGDLFVGALGDAAVFDPRRVGFADLAQGDIPPRDGAVHPHRDVQ